jgi:hypothetical protein
MYGDTILLIIPSSDSQKNTKKYREANPTIHADGHVPLLLLSSRRDEQTPNLGMRDVESFAYLPQALPLAA